jgi:hypothetical protein
VYKVGGGDLIQYNVVIYKQVSLKVRLNDNTVVLNNSIKKKKYYFTVCCLKIDKL